jgi:hypothetical protein
LYVAGTRASRAGVAKLARLPLLEDLDARFVPLDDEILAGVAGHGRLRRLWLEQCPISDRGLTAVAGLSKLRTLELQGTNITDAAMPALQRLAELSTLSLQRNHR